MLEFRTLGKLDLWGEDGQRIESVLPHSKRLSLLAYLCVSHPPRLHRRDTLIALFWPELDDAHARGALRQELSRLRHALGRDVILGEGSEAVGVDAARLWCDAAAFQAALHAGELSSALGLFGGEFLPGLHVDGGEFDRWLDGARDSLRRGAVDAARSLSAEAEVVGDLARAVDGARRLTELAPYDETGWQRLIMLLDLCGDRAGALTAYDDLTTRLKAELELEPSPETRALRERIRTRIEAFAGTASPSVRTGLPAAAPAPPVVLPPGMVAVRILPIENQTGDPRRDVIAQWLTDRLARWISELYWVHLADEQRVLARVVVSGSLQARGGLVEVRTRLAEPGERGAILAAPDPVLLESLSDTALLDTLVARVAATLAARYHPRLGVPPGIPAPFRTPSYEAFLWYLTGSELFGEFRFAEAAANLSKAYEIDPTFVKAAQFSAISLAWGGDPAAAETLASAAMAANQPLPDYERYFGQWILALLRGRREEAYRNARETARLTSHPLLQGVLACEALRHGRAGEVVRTMQAVEDWGIGWWRNWTNIAEAHAAALHVLGDHTSELAAVLSRRAVISESFDLIRAEIRARAALGQSAEVVRLVEEAQTIPSSHTTELPPAVTTPADIAWVAAQELDHHGQSPAAVTARGIGLDWLRARSDPTRAEQLLRVRLLLEMGDAGGAQRILDTLAPLADPWSLGVAGLVAAARGDTVTAGQVIASLQAMDNPYLSGFHLLEAAGVQAALDQADAAVATLRDARARGLPYGVELHALPTLRPLVGRSDFADLLRPRG
jgi:DNA-binding SARP family transcriptional activator